MLRRLRKSTGGRPARKIAPVELADDTEKTMFNSKEDLETDQARQHHHSRPKLPEASQLPHHDYSVHEITDVPAPIPDTGLPPPSADTATLVTSPVSASYIPVASKSSSSRPHMASKSTYVPLPSLKTQNITEIEEKAAQSSFVIHPTLPVQPVVETTAGSNSRDRSPQLNTSHLSTTAVIALAISGGLTFFIIAVLVKLFQRPRRRTPTPSLPILHDGIFPDDNAESEGSPVFGGKERSSPSLQARGAKGNTGLWTWTQYNSGIPKPAPTVTVTRSSPNDPLLAVRQTTQQDNLGAVDSDTTYIQGQNEGQYPFVGYGSPNVILKSKSAVPLQPVQNAITRAVSRLSTVSMSLYPNSPGGYSQVGADVGLAIDGVVHDELAAASKYKDRMLASRNRLSMMAPGSAKGAAALRRSQSFAYGGMEPTSPPNASPNMAQSNGGRVRIKSAYYTPSSYPRTSAAATNYGKRDVDHEHDGIRLEQNRVGRADARRGRDLTSTLSPRSSTPPSPQLTLYPDDSVSVIGEAKKVTLTGRSQKKPVPKAKPHCESPTPDAAALGSLMMVDFAASKSTASLVNIRPSEAARQGGTCTGATGKSSLKRRVDDKPPRVPSPPPIPSLAQMALQHGDPEGYADYHSPTYSIYGLYDGDRKSRGVSYGQ